MSTLQTLRSSMPRFTLKATTMASRAFSSTPAAANLARMSIIGRLGSTPEPTQTSTGRTVFRYAVATNYGPRDDRQTSWFNISHFLEDGERGEARGQYLAGLEKGTLVAVEAEARMATYDGEDGKKHRALNLTQRSFQVLARPNRSASDEDAADIS